jgi:hypothetical protein
MFGVHEFVSSVGLPLCADLQDWVSSAAWPYLHLLGSLGPAVAVFMVTAVLTDRADWFRTAEHPRSILWVRIT